jgi:hypothetical protein
MAAFATLASSEETHRLPPRPIREPGILSVVHHIKARSER